MKVSKLKASDEDLLDGGAAVWRDVAETQVEMMPAPVGMAEEISPFMAQSQDHGAVRAVKVQLAQNGTTFWARLSWPDGTRDDAPDDLDQFVDGAAIMFPLVPGASALTMGAKGQPVNAWAWKADEEEPFDIVAQGYSTSQRRAAEASGLKCAAVHRGGHWTLVFQRPLEAGEDFVSLGAPGLAMAVAIWDGANKERAGQKSVSGEFTPLEGVS